MTGSLKDQLLAKGFEETPQKERKMDRSEFKTVARKRLKNTDDMLREVYALLREINKLKGIPGSSKWFAGFRRSLRLLKEQLEENGNPESNSEQKKLIKNLW